jgi:signal transduction histidine kinase
MVLRDMTSRGARLIGLVAVCSSILTLFAFSFAHRNRNLQLDAVLEKASNHIVSSLQVTFDIHVESAESLASFFIASEYVSRKMFKEVVDPALARHPGIQAFEWVPRVRSAEREMIESRMRNEWFPEFRFTERDYKGDLVTAGERDEYYPVIYVEPMVGNEMAYGYADMGAARTEAIESARDSGRPSTTPRLTLIQEKAAQFGMLIFVPLYEANLVPDTIEERREKLLGFIEGVYRMDELVKIGLSELNQTNLLVALFDTVDSMDPRPLVLWPGGNGDPIASEMSVSDGQLLRTEIESSTHIHHRLQMPQRNLDLFIYPDEGFAKAVFPWGVLLVLIGGIVITVLLTGTTYLIQTRATLVERQVEERTAELHASEVKLFQAQKMESVGRLAGGIAHDFNNLLAAILGNTELAQFCLDDNPAEIPDYLKQIRRVAMKASDLTKQLLTFSRQRVHNAEQTNLSQVVDDLQELLRRLVGEQVTLSIKNELPDAWVFADRNQLEQMIINLAVNATDAMPDGGRLELSISRVAARMDETEKVVFQVRDDGVGMDEMVTSRIFDPFFTTKDVGKGTGLGLAMVYAMVTQSGGQIEVDSEEGRGTCFTISLPMCQAATENEDGRKLKPTMVDSKRSGGILVVEDNVDVRDTLRDLLRRLGYDVSTAATGQEALDLFPNLSHTLHLVISDLVMPGMNGVEMVKQMRLQNQTIRYLFMTGYAMEDLQNEIEQLSDGGVLNKPFSNQELLRRIDELLITDEMTG